MAELRLCFFINVNVKMFHLPLFSAYQNNDISEFEKILKTNRRNIMDDPFIREHIEGKFLVDIYITFFGLEISDLQIFMGFSGNRSVDV